MLQVEWYVDQGKRGGSLEPLQSNAMQMGVHCFS